MKHTILYRHDSKACHEELAKSLQCVIPFRSYDFLTDKALVDVLSNESFMVPQKRWAKLGIDSGHLIALIYSSKDKNLPAAAISIVPERTPDKIDIGFVNCFCRVFNEDIRTAPALKEHGDLWQILRQTQFRRAIGKFSAFSTSNITHLLQIIEDTTALRHEGKPFSYCLFLTKQEQWLKEPLGDRYIPFAKRIPYARGLMSEDWIRAAVDGNRVGLVALGHGHGLVAMFNVPPFDEKTEWMFAPHESVVTLQRLLVDGTALFIVSPAGDVYVLLHDLRPLKIIVDFS